MTTTYTPAPWTIVGPSAPGRLHDDGGDYAILAHGEVIAEAYRRVSKTCLLPVAANARLIAAAPELLEALKLATHELHTIRARDGAPQQIEWSKGRPIHTDSCTHEWWHTLTEQCLAAIAKAEKEGA